jgi:hypothetical protein
MQMRTQTRVLFTFGVLVLLITGIYLFTGWFSKTTGYTLGEDEKIKFAQCLETKNTVLYIEENCWPCEQQQKILGTSAYKIIPKITCGADSCQGIKSFPAWQINGQFYYGKKDFDELSTLSGCSIK